MHKCNRRSFVKTTAAALGAAFMPRISVGAAPKRVIVIGAGLAGLAAAYELNQAGHDVTVIEARTRPGGRLRTLREPFSDGLTAEAGGMAFSESYKQTMRFVNRFSVPYGTPQIDEAGAARFLRGRRLIERPGADVNWPYELTAEERRLGRMGMLRQYALDALGDIGDPTASYSLAPWMARLDRITFAGLLRSRGASAGAVELISRTFWFAAQADSDSAASVFLSNVALYFLGQTSYQFRGGSDLLPLAIADSLRERIRYGTPVVRIAHGPAGVRVVTDGVGGRAAMDADDLICTLPFSVLRLVEVEPAFSSEKQRVIRELEYAAVTRVFVQVRRRVWQSERVTGGAYTDLPILQVQVHPAVRAGQVTARSILEAHIRGPQALPVAAMNERERILFAIKHLDTLRPGIAREAEGGASYAWSEDPWARGAYATFRPGQLTEWLPIIAQAEGRVHFAGEHTSVFPKTMEGAIESGVRAAREVAGAG